MARRLRVLVAFMGIPVLMVVGVLGYFATAVTFAAEGMPNPGVPSFDSGYSVEVVGREPYGVVLEFSLHSPELFSGLDEAQRLQVGQLAGVIPGATVSTEPGLPQVPVIGELLGIGVADGVSLEILDVDYETWDGVDVTFAPQPPKGEWIGSAEGESIGEPYIATQERSVSSTYAPEGPYPSQVAVLGTPGYLRDQAVVPVRFYPVQVELSTHQARIYKRIRVRVSWSSAALSGQMVRKRGTRSAAFDALLQRAILNYSSPQPVVEPKHLAPAATVTSPLPALKLYVDRDAIYRLTYDDFVRAGLDPTQIDPRRLQMLNRGDPISIYVFGEADGIFDPGDWIAFYGQAVHDDQYTVQNVYWLLLDEAGPNQRMGVQSGAPLTGSSPAHFPTTVHLEEDHTYWGNKPKTAEEDHWYWSGVIQAPPPGKPQTESSAFTITMDLSSLSTVASNASLRVQLHGFTDIPTANPDHRSRVILNGQIVDEQTWDGREVFTHTISFDHSLLQESTNTLVIQNVGDTGAGELDQFLVNWVELDYWQKYVADEDELRFGAPSTGTFHFTLSGFSDENVWVFDVTESGQPILITDTQISLVDSTYQVEFRHDIVDDNARLIAVTWAKFAAPAKVDLDKSSSWRTSGHQADYIIISHQAFISDVTPLADLRRSQGLQVAVVDIEDIYDEFNFGIMNPRAVRDFLSYAYHQWQEPAPTYVLLAGGATIDYRDNLKWGRKNWVPTQVVDTGEFGERVSDNWFVLVEGDDILPDMFIGRLPAQNRAQMQAMVANILAYTQNPPDSTWNNRVLMVADDNTIFEATSEAILERFPYYFDPTRVYVGDYSAGSGVAPADDIVESINNGVLVVNYVGHGNINTWGGARVFDNSYISQLNNTNKLPLVTVGNCLNGYFVWGTESSAEAFLRRQGRGAIGVWAPSGLDYPSGHQLLLDAFYAAVFQKDLYQLGASTTAAKIVAYTANAFWENLVHTYILFGDPAIALGVPTNYPYVERTTPEDGAVEVPLNQDIVITLNKPLTEITVTLRDETGQVVALEQEGSSADDTEFTYSHQPLMPNTVYTVTISGKDRLGLALRDGPSPRAFSFSTTTDTVPPTGSLSIEGGMITNVPLTATIKAEFSEPVQWESLVYVITPTVSMLTFPDPDFRKFTFYPNPSFEPETVYIFEIADVQDMAGNSMPSSLKLEFQTRPEQHTLYLPSVSR